MKLPLKLIIYNKEWIVFFGCIFIFLLLLFKDPFSERTLIPNLEPYPDTFSYIDPAINLIKGSGFNLSREGRSITPNVPPLYSLILAPVFLVKTDPRMAYFINVVLSLSSLLLFWLILKKLFLNRIIIYFLLILYITNYFIYWVPTIIMAENLTLTLFLAALLLLLSRITILNLIITAGLVTGIYGSKYASLSVSISLLLLYLIKILFSKFTYKEKIGLFTSFCLVSILCYLPLAFFEQSTKGSSLISQAFIILVQSYSNIPKDSSQPQTTANSWFGVQYISKNLPLYLNSLIGNPNRFLWDNTPIVPKFVALGGFAGIVVNFFYKKSKFICIGLAIFLITSVAFMSVFYTFDARYIYIAIPTLLVGFGFFLERAEKIFTKYNRVFFNYLILLAVVIYLFISFVRIKSQISLNLRYAETPWYYISVLKLNEYFTKDKVINGKKPVVISALPPFFIDYYSNGNYSLLPLSYDQEFRGFKEIVWGPNDYSDLPKLYKKYLMEGYNLYVSRYGLGNEGYTNRDFDNIIKEFDTKLVFPGCFEQCNIYKVMLKN